MKGVLILLLWLFRSWCTGCSGPLRIKQLQRCGDLFSDGRSDGACVPRGSGKSANGMAGRYAAVEADIERQGDRLTLKLARQAQRSARSGWSMAAAPATRYG
jgi:hypothetical protein